MLTDEEVRKIARLARVSISDEEVALYATELSSILDYVKKLELVDVKDVEAMTHVHGSSNVFREDNVVPSLAINEALANVPDRSGQFIRVPIVQEELGE